MTNQAESSTSKKPAKPKQNGGFLGNLAFNIVIPVLILTNLSGEDSLGPAWSVVIALLFPIGFGLWDLKKSGKVNGFSVLGIISIFLTGGITLLKLPAEYIAIKEAAIPLLIGIAVLVSQFTQKPLVRLLILNENVIDLQALNLALENKNNTALFNQKVNVSSYIVTASFFLSSALNYILAKMILVSEPGTTAYIEELGRMTALSYPVIVIPSTIMLFGAIGYLFVQMKKLTGEDFFTFILEEA
ncbi:VC0807 family protein [Aliiglaciecola sp. LCG003]|uniref:VC0807 family protein n=1 Tax=Aliiglaciecola sp. LCG003 TaxID=3053655 RepID=UPI002574242C|nr:VC0807 family protein [Aliiglaciecola sp. LCG003]WJG08447.1 VC0807 family protein [Aliiglaciecola sp. LCG003]